MEYNREGIVRTVLRSCFHVRALSSFFMHNRLCGGRFYERYSRITKAEERGVVLVKIFENSDCGNLPTSLP